jgi:hypothetical protein
MPSSEPVSFPQPVKLQIRFILHRIVIPSAARDLRYKIVIPSEARDLHLLRDSLSPLAITASFPSAHL